MDSALDVAMTALWDFDERAWRECMLLFDNCATEWASVVDKADNESDVRCER